MAPSETWTDPEQCPFCGGQLLSPGSGFIAHLRDHPECASGFETWRDRVQEDIRAGWAG